MRHLTKLTTGAALAATLALPAGAAADKPSRSDFRDAAKHCKELRESSGTRAAFRSAVDEFARGKVTEKNAYGKCVSAQARREQRRDQSARRQAVRDCKDEGHERGRGNGNAFGRCVSRKFRENEQEAEREDRNELNAARECRAEKEQGEDEFTADHDGETFAEFYGTNANNRNAFGKCVSKKAREKDDEQEQGAGS